MDFEQTMKTIGEMEPRDGFSPADLLDFPSLVVAVLRFLMGKRNKEMSALATKLELDRSQVSLLLEALADKGFVKKSAEGSSSQLAFEANLK